MELVISKILLFIFFLSLIFLVYYIIRVIHLLVSIKNDTITPDKFIDIKNDLFESTKLKILWFSLSYLLFFIFL
jgi:hypothetical protein